MICEEKSQFCTGQDLRLVQMKSNRGGITRGNIYAGRILIMCKGCRFGQNGQFKYVTPPKPHE